MDYALYDRMRDYRYRADRLAKARELGFNHIFEATYKLYQKHRSTIKVAEILGLTASGVGAELKYFEVELEKRGGRRY